MYICNKRDSVASLCSSGFIISLWPHMVIVDSFCHCGLICSLCPKSVSVASWITLDWFCHFYKRTCLEENIISCLCIMTTTYPTSKPRVITLGLGGIGMSFQKRITYSLYVQNAA